MNKMYSYIQKEISNLTPEKIIEKVNKTENYICNYNEENKRFILQKRIKRKDKEFFKFVGEFSLNQMKNLIKFITDYKEYF